MWEIWDDRVPVYDRQRVAQAGLLVVLALLSPLVHRSGSSVSPPVPRWVSGTLAGIAALGFLSAVTSARPGHALRETALLILLGMLGWTAASLRAQAGEPGHRLLAYAVAVSCLCYLVVVAGIRTLGVVDPVSAARDTFIGFAHPRHFGQLLSWTLPLVVLPWAAFRPATALSRIGLAGAGAGWWTLLLMSGSRGSMLALAAGFAASLLLLRGRALPWLRAQLLAAAGGALGYLLFARAGGASLLGSAIERGLADNGRFALWRRSLALIRDDPWLGVGPGLFAYRPLPVVDAPASHPHNAVLQIASEWGVPAAVLLASVAAWGAWRWTASARRGSDGPADDALRTALTASLVAAAVHSLLSGILVTPLSQTFGAVIAGWAASLPADSRPPRESLGRRRLALDGALIVLAIGLAASLWLPRTQVRPGQIVGPRFWLSGEIP